MKGRGGVKERRRAALPKPWDKWSLRSPRLTIWYPLPAPPTAELKDASTCTAASRRRRPSVRVPLGGTVTVRFPSRVTANLGRGKQTEMPISRARSPGVDMDWRKEGGDGGRLGGEGMRSGGRERGSEVTVRDGRNGWDEVGGKEERTGSGQEPREGRKET